MCVYIGREAKVGNYREWPLTSLARNRPTTHKQFSLREVITRLIDVFLNALTIVYISAVARANQVRGD